MKVHRSPSPVLKKAQAVMARNASAPAVQGADLFDALDLFLTGLILDRAPAGDRSRLGDWLASDAKPARARSRKKAAFASN